jgi:hypothetical protein
MQILALEIPSQTSSLRSKNQARHYLMFGKRRHSRHIAVAIVWNSESVYGGFLSVMGGKLSAIVALFVVICSYVTGMVIGIAYFEVQALPIQGIEKRVTRRHVRYLLLEQNFEPTLCWPERQP